MGFRAGSTTPRSLVKIWPVLASPPKKPAPADTSATKLSDRDRFRLRLVALARKRF